jgi:hypothetical protein
MISLTAEARFERETGIGGMGRSKDMVQETASIYAFVSHIRLVAMSKIFG